MIEMNLSQAIAAMAAAEEHMQTCLAEYREAKLIADTRHREATRAREAYEAAATAVKVQMAKTSKEASSLVWISQIDNTEKSVRA